MSCSATATADVEEKSAIEDQETEREGFGRRRRAISEITHKVGELRAVLVSQTATCLSMLVYCSRQSPRCYLSTKRLVGDRTPAGMGQSGVEEGERSRVRECSPTYAISISRPSCYATPTCTLASMSSPKRANQNAYTRSAQSQIWLEAKLLSRSIQAKK
ncbi:hypothetical protein DL93DRAFT_1300121 [Clavulina sp. PMI_390]|nr:hypothetical protein DL93DRAFT_1300121 [Clavulina sp. PMI_390]